HCHGDPIILFPNWDKNKNAEFFNHRAKGAFLLSAACSGGAVDYVDIFSEKGGKCRLKNPWNGSVTELDVPANGNITLNKECF
ncbi:MAG: glycosyl hydrolase family 95 catalytic domain-containing protein, partial [Saccharofermentanales bacterium]